MGYKNNKNGDVKDGIAQLFDLSLLKKILECILSNPSIMELPQSPLKAKIETEQMHTQFYTDAMFAILIKSPIFLISMSGLTQNQ